MKKLFLSALLVATSMTFLASNAEAKKFRTDFISLELPPAWDCVKEEIDWVCQPDSLAQRSEAIVVIVAKNANAVDDNFETYENVLKEPRDMRDLLGNTYKSEVKYVRFKTIKDQKWIDALTFGSEIPGFFSRYVASIKGKVAGLVTYSIAESVYAKWAPILDKMLDSLELHFDPKAFNDAMNASPSSLLGQRANNAGRFAPMAEDNSKEKSSGEEFDLVTVFIGILLAGGVAFFIWKKKQKQG